MRSDEPPRAAASGPARPGDGPEDVRRPREPRRARHGVLAAVAAGGALGSLARFEASRLWPTAPDAFPWTTLTVNAVGCLLLGVLLVAVTEVFAAHPLLRPFLGTGVLGGFTTFSTYCADIGRLLGDGRAPVALAYLVATVVAAAAAAGAGVFGARRLLADRSAS
ncbi:fluoride efflux transporter FluC [Streptomyces sp. NPDC001744]|uniref:fluoride efflux transporter FluC n=1 Tax=Streptomyces sp. NPDC001744 TaxID=3364606 RepID=UPI003685C55F